MSINPTVNTASTLLKKRTKMKLSAFLIASALITLMVIMCTTVQAAKTTTYAKNKNGVDVPQKPEEVYITCILMSMKLRFLVKFIVHSSCLF